jgi:hypothetical protein
MVGFGTTKFTRAWEPALLWNQLRSSAKRKAMVSAIAMLRQLPSNLV